MLGIVKDDCSACLPVLNRDGLEMCLSGPDMLHRSNMNNWTNNKKSLPRDAISISKRFSILAIYPVFFPSRVKLSIEFIPIK